MKLTRDIVLTRWAGEWSRLKAWNRTLEVSVEISDRQCADRLGTCWPTEQRLVIYRGRTIQGELHTLLHELAHAAVPASEGHSLKWQAIYAAAIQEVTGIPVPVAGDNYRIVNFTGIAAMESWWRSSGNEFLWRLCK